MVGERGGKHFKHRELGGKAQTKALPRFGEK